MSRRRLWLEPGEADVHPAIRAAHQALMDFESVIHESDDDTRHRLHGQLGALEDRLHVLTTISLPEPTGDAA